MSSFNIDVETNLNLTFPLPYRVLALIGLGILAWATNLHGLHLLGIDAVAALELRTEGYSLRSPRTEGYGRHKSPSVHYLAAYRIFFAYAAFCFTSWTIFRVCTKSDALLIDAFGHIPLIAGILVLIVLVCPMNVFYKYERDKFLDALHRCFLSSFDAPIYFSDVVFADIATSFAKVLGDVWLSFVMLLPGHSLLMEPSGEGWHRWILPTIMSLPYFLRFRQCIIEFYLPSNTSRRPLMNAVKYATAFPVIFLSAAQKNTPMTATIIAGDGISSYSWHATFRLWLLAAAINSIYSFWWDVTNDWGLEMLKKQRGFNDFGHRTPPRRLQTPLLSRTSLDSVISEDHLHSNTPSRATSPIPQRLHPWGLRASLLYPLPIYPLLVFLNLILRMTWSIKLSSHLYSVSDGSVGIFWLEVAEITRRWLWVFLRVEWEVIRKAQDGNAKSRADDFNRLNEFEMVSTAPDDHYLHQTHDTPSQYGF